MPTVRLGAMFGALCLLGSCVPVDDDPPVSGSKQIQQLSGHEIVALCDWATDYMGGRLSNPGEGGEVGESIVHRCPGDIGVPSDEEPEVAFVSFNYLECPGNLSAEANRGCTLTVSDFAGWIRAIGDTPCRHHYVNNGQCQLLWEGAEEAP
jgi:hypothetical protein